MDASEELIPRYIRMPDPRPPASSPVAPSPPSSHRKRRYLGSHKTKGKAPPRCQCDPNCSNPPLPQSPFCKAHQHHCSRRAPLTGWEPAYEPDRYNRHPGIRESHNCYTYALNYLHLPRKKNCTKKSCPLPFPQPGRASGYPRWSKVKGKRCPDLLARVMGDVPGSAPSTFEARCPAGKRKIAIVADEDQDYHLFRQDANGDWSHKPGATDVIPYDATKRRIYDPELASRDYPQTGLNYDEFCGYLCIPATKRHHLRRGGARKTRRSRVSSSSRSSKRSKHR